MWRKNYLTFVEMGNVRSLADFGYFGYFANTNGEIFAFRYKTCGCSPDQVADIRLQCESGLYTHKELAEQYHVSKSQIGWMITNRLRLDFFKVSSSINREGYVQINLYVNKHQYIKHVHVLILTAFCGLRPIGMECRHLDGNKLNNHLDNLCWGTRRENVDDRLKHGGYLVGEDVHTSKLTADDVLQIRELRQYGLSCIEIGKRYGVSRNSIYDIINHKRWKHLL